MSERTVWQRALGRLKDERGSTLPLIAFYAFLGLALILLVASATSLYLERKRLFTLADGAALAGAEAFDLSDVSAAETRLRPRLEESDVARTVAAHIASAPGADFEALAVDRATSDDGLSATVELSATWRPPMLSVLVPAGLRIEVAASARSVFG